MSRYKWSTYTVQYTRVAPIDLIDDAQGDPSAEVTVYTKEVQYVPSDPWVDPVFVREQMRMERQTDAAIEFLMRRAGYAKRKELKGA